MRATGRPAGVDAAKGLVHASRCLSRFLLVCLLALTPACAARGLVQLGRQPLPPSVAPPSPPPSPPPPPLPRPSPLSPPSPYAPPPVTPPPPMPIPPSAPPPSPRHLMLSQRSLPLSPSPPLGSTCYGCFRNNATLLVPTQLSPSSVPSLTACGALAAAAGFDVFAMQAGYQCFGCLSSSPKCAPFALGPVPGGCAALGGAWVYQVCTLNAAPPWPQPSLPRPPPLLPSPSHPLRPSPSPLPLPRPVPSPPTSPPPPLKSPPPPPHNVSPPPPPIFSGFDIVFVAGQSNSVGFALTSDTADTVNDNTAGLPIFYLRAGQAWNGPQGSPEAWNGSAVTSVGQLDELVINLPSTGYGPAVSSSFAVNFSKSYVAAGLLAPGRALLIVSTGWGGTGFSAFPSSTTYAFPSRDTTLVLLWAPNTQCNPNLPALGAVSSATMGSQPLTMSLFTHAQYRVDYALSLDPATGKPAAGQPWGYVNPANRVVVMLWHQGEADVSWTVSNWAGCLHAVIAGWRARYGASVPFVAGTFSPGLDGDPRLPSLPAFSDLLRYNFDPVAPGGRYRAPCASAPCGYYTVLTNATMPRLGLPWLGLADSHYVVTPAGLQLDKLPNDPQTNGHFSILGYQGMGSRYFAAYAQIVFLQAGGGG